MTLFQHIAMWSLRALLVWGGVEAGGGLYAAGAEHWTSLQRIAGHRTAMTRLEERARSAETELQTANAALAEHSGAAWRLTLNAGETPEQAAARQLRETLIELGAEAPVVDGEGAAGSSPARVTLTARWREPSATAPQILHALAQRHPAFTVERLSLANTDVATTEVVLTTPVLVATGRDP
ncbi:MAG: hypothetical protein JNM59_06630 [Hyphomonadaceae bacterium]|nr:hypothetical protein [Hyphomonadaceae bacterium]